MGNFESNKKTKNGFKECWGSLADPNPHIFDLYYGGTLKSEDGDFYLDELISLSRTSLYDIVPERLKNKKGEIGVRAQRQMIQLQYNSV